MCMNEVKKHLAGYGWISVPSSWSVQKRARVAFCQKPSRNCYLNWLNRNMNALIEEQNDTPFIFVGSLEGGLGGGGGHLGPQA